MELRCKEIISRIREQTQGLIWGGGFVSRNIKKYFRFEAGKRTHSMILKTILPKSFLRVELRLMYATPYEVTEFNPEEHNYVYELKLIDDLKRSEDYEIYAFKQEEGVELLEELFNQSKPNAIFRHKQESIETKKRALNRLIQIIG